MAVYDGFKVLSGAVVALLESMDIVSRPYLPKRF